MKIHEFVPVIGAPLESDGDKLRFKGSKTQDQNQPGQEKFGMGLYLARPTFSGGTISMKVTFDKVNTASGAEIALFYDPATTDLLTAGIPARSHEMFCVRAYEKQWNVIAATGEHSGLKEGKEYHLEAVLLGSLVSLRCDGVEVVKTVLPKQYRASQIGLFLLGEHDAVVSDFSVSVTQPRVFVISQFTSPYNEVYIEVIKAICKEQEIEVIRADETQGPGLIIADVVREIRRSTFVIADISPVNANVFYELGYAHGIRKPAILIAQRETKLPFDVSPFRTLFYDNTIAGKTRLEQGLREAIRAVLGETPGTPGSS